MSRGTADLVGLVQKGRIAVGADADLVAFAADERFTVHAAELQHKNPISAFEGRELRGVARRVWLRGHPVSEVPAGELLETSRS
jgi:allantoinase